MESPRCGIVIPTRLKSSRLPSKVLKRIMNNEPMIVMLLKNIVPNNPFPVVVALPKSAEDDVIVNVINDNKIPVKFYRGEDDSPSHRMLSVAEQEKWDYVVRLTHDNPLIDRRIMLKQITHAMRNELDYCYVLGMPQGTTGEVIKVSALKRIMEGAKHTEYLTYLLKRKDVKGEAYRVPKEYCYDARLTIDYPEDLQLLRIISHNLAPGFTTLDVINYLKRNNYLLNLNRLPDISVLITNFNYSKYIVDALVSVAAQSEQSWECMLYDDGSTDDSLSKTLCFLSALDGVISRRFRLYAVPKNIGLGAICNRALPAVRGKYYIRLDSDDMLRNDALSNMRRPLDAIEGLEGVWSAYQKFGSYMESSIVAPGPEYEHHPACCMLRTETVLATGYREKYEFHEGADFLERYRKQYHITYLDEALWARRIHPAQMTQTVPLERQIEIAEGINGAGRI